jgi:Rho-binding antiterminator
MMNRSPTDPDRPLGEDDGDTTYSPVQCGLHDVLESLATRRETCVIRHAGPPDQAETVTSGTIADVFSRSGAEYLRMADGETIRLDRIRSLEAGGDTIDFR